MPDILHRISIDASPNAVHGLISSADGIERWWTGGPVKGDTAVGGRFELYFGDADSPAAIMKTESDTADELVWRVVGGPDSWLDTSVRFELNPGPDGGTTLLFTHADWREASEFMSGCSTNWGAYLTSLKTGAEGKGFHPHPEGHTSRW